MSRKKVFMIDGGAGRIVTSIPAFEKYAKKHPNEDWNIVVFGFDNLFFGNHLLQNRVYSGDNKGIFDNLLKESNIISPEPYRLWEYYNQKYSIAEAFDHLINETNDHSDLEKPNLYLSKGEEKFAANVISEVKKNQKKDITIVIQPFGRSSRIDNGDIIDDSSRSLEPHVYLSLIKKLSQRYNIILMAEKDYQNQLLETDKISHKVEADLRNWSAIIESADYFVGCDSVGQHLARAFEKPGTVILGSTYAVNVSYPDFFNIIENENVEKVYSPIRLCGFDCYLADKLNDRCMEFNEEQIDKIYKNIVNDIKEKVK